MHSFELKILSSFHSQHFDFNVVLKILQNPFKSYPQTASVLPAPASIFIPINKFQSFRNSRQSMNDVHPRARTGSFQSVLLRRRRDSCDYLLFNESTKSLNPYLDFHISLSLTPIECLPNKLFLVASCLPPEVCQIP